MLGEGSYGKVFLGVPAAPKNQKLQKVNEKAPKLDSSDVSKNIACLDENGQSPIPQLQVAIKILDKNKISHNEIRTKHLVTEIRVHWTPEKCDGALRLLEIFEDDLFVYIVLEYQKMGSLLG